MSNHHDPEASSQSETCEARRQKSGGGEGFGQGVKGSRGQERTSKSGQESKAGHGEEEAETGDASG